MLDGITVGLLDNVTVRTLEAITVGLLESVTVHTLEAITVGLLDSVTVPEDIAIALDGVMVATEDKATVLLVNVT